MKTTTTAALLLLAATFAPAQDAAEPEAATSPSPGTEAQLPNDVTDDDTTDDEDAPVTALIEDTPSPAGNAGTSAFDDASSKVQRQLQDAIAELNAVREQMAAEKIPMNRELGERESERVAVQRELQQTTRQNDRATLELSNLTQQIEAREAEVAYLSNLLSDYLREFASKLHIAEVQRYGDELDTVRLAEENGSLADRAVFEIQAELVATSLERLHEALGGVKFPGTAVDEAGLVHEGEFVLVGPSALFRSHDGQCVGTVEQRLGSLEPALIKFGLPEDAASAGALVASGAGAFPLDPTLGNAHKVEATEETLWEHVQKGGAVMVPIFALAGVGLLVALYKWISFALLRRPSKKQITGLLEGIAARDAGAVEERVSKMRGPLGRMLATGVEHLREPRELIEEVMYETVLTTRLQLQRMLPFIAICAAAAPLLGLLGTVTGIINTFKMITLFGSGDVKTLSGGISEALITTKFGLIVAIPSLLMHAFLSRKARGVIGEMESAAVAFVNQVSKTPWREDGARAPSHPTPPAPPTPAGPERPSDEPKITDPDLVSI